MNAAPSTLIRPKPIDYRQRWLDRQPPERLAVLKDRDAAFKLHHVPNWFRRAVLKAKREQRWNHHAYSASGWAALEAFTFRFGHGNGPQMIDHYGTCGRAFVSQPYADLPDGTRWAQTVATALDLDVTIDADAPWFSGCVWIAWTPKASKIEGEQR